MRVSLAPDLCNRRGGRWPQAVGPATPHNATGSRYARHSPSQPQRRHYRREWLWLGITVAASIIAIAMVWQLLPHSAPPPTLQAKSVFVPAKAEQFSALLGPQGRSAYWWIRFDLDNHKLLVVTLKEPIIPSNRMAALWLVAKAGAPIPLGVLPRYKSAEGALPQLPAAIHMAGSKLAVTLEPRSKKAPVDPTGPVVFTTLVHSSH